MLIPVVGLTQMMNNQKLLKILESEAESIEGTTGAWQISVRERMMLVITDEGHDRMRIISPVRVVDEVTSVQLREAMQANFHSALDVRYAIADDILWSAFLHPLESLTEEQVRAALRQVYRAAETFGSSYSSSELVFPGGKGRPRTKDDGSRRM